MIVTQVDVGDGGPLEVVRVSGVRPGPVLALLGRIHGDEPEGTLAIGAALARLDAGELAGTVVAAPTANPPAARAGTRESPLDGRNLARVFPGDPAGTVTERIAAALVERVIAGADLLIDLHSGGAGYEMPFFAGYSDDGGPLTEQAATAAAAFGTPFLWRHAGVTEGRSLSAARALGIPSIYVEATGGGTLYGPEHDLMVGGIRRVMALLGMVTGADPAPAPPRILDGGAGDTDAALQCTQSGYCLLRAGAGTVVQAGTVIAEVVDEGGRVLEVISAPCPALVAMVRRHPRVSAGEGIVMLGPVPDAAD